jgi:hypothetical protein
MHRPPVALVAAVAVVVLTAGCLGGVTAATPTDTRPATPDVAPGEAVDGTAIAVSGTGSVEAAPDQATVSVTVTERAASADTASDRLATATDAVRAALADAGVAADDVETRHYHVGPRYDHRHDRDREPTGYVATHALVVTVRDVADAGRVVDAAVAAGADRIDGVRFGLSDDRRQELRDDAVAAAMADARADAEALAASESLAVTGVHRISTGSPSYPAHASADGRAEAGGETSFAPGPVTVTVHVTVTYVAGEN